MYGHEKVTNNAIRLIMAGILVGYRIEYELVDATLKTNINLRRWKKEIISSVQDVLPYAHVEVFKDFYRITIGVLPTFEEVKKIGSNIASNKHIGKYVRVHSYTTWFFYFAKSNKLFKRKKQSVKSMVIK